MLLDSGKVILFSLRLGNKSEHVFVLSSCIRVLGIMTDTFPTIVFFLSGSWKGCGKGPRKNQLFDDS